MKNKHWLSLSIAILIVALAYVFLSLRRPDASREIAYYSPEHKMAVFNTGGRYVPPRDPVVQQFAGLLDSLGKKCANSREEIADECISAYRREKERGKLTTLLEITRFVDDSIPSQQSLSDIKELVAKLM